MSHAACQEQNCPTCYHVCPSSPSSLPPESSLGDGAHGIWHPSVPSRSPCETKGVAKAFPDWGQTGVCGRAALSPSRPTSALPRATSPLASPPPTPHGPGGGYCQPHTTPGSRFEGGGGELAGGNRGKQMGPDRGRAPRAKNVNKNQ